MGSKFASAQMEFETQSQKRPQSSVSIVQAGEVMGEPYRP